MTARLIGLAAFVLVAGCGTSAGKEDNDRLCATVRSALAGAGLPGTPTQDQARAAAARLDGVLTAVADPGLHDHVIRLHQHLHDVDVAWSKRGPGEAAKSAGQARGDAERVATACGLAPADLTGG